MSITRNRLASRAFPFVALLAVAVAGVVATPAGQGTPPAARATGVIVGRVVDGTTDAPLAGTTVTLSGAGLRPRRVIVDPRGRFMFTELPAGAFTINATKAGFLDGTYGRLRADGNGRPLELQENEHVTDAVIRLWRYATISGTVTDDAGDPVPYLRVQVMKRAVIAGNWRLTTTGLGGGTDARGAYRITGLTPGEYALVITSLISTLPASLQSAADAEKRNPGGLLTDLQAKGTAGFANDLMQGFGVIRVGDLLLQTTADKTAPIAPDGRAIEIYPTLWYPAGSTPADAQLVTVAAGDNRSGVDLHPVLTKTTRISGVVLGPEGPVSHLALRLLPAKIDDVAAEITSSLALSMTTAMTASDANGAFTFLAVPPGQYVIRALTTPRPPPEPAPPPTLLTTADGMSTSVSSGPALPPLVPTVPTQWAAVPVSVGDTETSGVTVTLRPGVRITGRVEFKGTAPQPDARALRTIRVSMNPADGHTAWLPSAYQAQIDANGGFYTIGLVANRYVLGVDSVPRGWTLKSALVDGHDICDEPLTLENSDVDGLVLTFTDRPSGMAGIVNDAQGRADENATVLLFPSTGDWTNGGTSPRRMRSVRASRTGAYTIGGIPAGEYFIAAVSDALVANWQAPAFLRQIARSATRVTVTDGQTATASLTTIGRVDR